VTYRCSLDRQALQRDVCVVLNPLQLGLVKLQPRQQAPVQLADLAAGPAIRWIVARLLPEALHRLVHALDDLLVRLRALPQLLGMTLDKVPVDLVQIDHGILDVLALLLEHIGAHADGVLEVAQPLAGVALLLIVLHGQVVAEDDDGQQQRVLDLGRARPQVLDALDHVGRRRALGVARRDARAERVRQHELPAAGEAALADVGFAEDEFCGGGLVTGARGG
jgi:hypothetical protein